MKKRMTETELCRKAAQFANHVCRRRNVPPSAWDDVAQEACIIALKASRAGKIIPTRGFFWIAARAVRNVARALGSKGRQVSLNQTVGNEEGDEEYICTKLNNSQKLGWTYGSPVSGWDSAFHPGG